MKKFFTIFTALTAGLFFALTTVQAKSSKVRIFVPTPNPVKLKKKPVLKQVIIRPEVVIERVYYVPYYTREQRLRLFVGPRYPGFHKQYRGPKYPF